MKRPFVTRSAWMRAAYLYAAITGAALAAVAGAPEGAVSGIVTDETGAVLKVRKSPSAAQT